MAERGVYYGWIVAGATFLVMLATAGAMGAPGVIIQPLEHEFGWSTAEISAAFSVRLALFGLIAPFAAAFINRFGVRAVIVSAVLVIAGGLLASMAMTEVWQLLALWGVVVGVGTGMVALVLGATVASRWFVQRRGLVVGMLTASNATGQLIFLPLIAKLTESMAGAARSPSSSRCCSSPGSSRSPSCATGPPTSALLHTASARFSRRRSRIWGSSR